MRKLSKKTTGAVSSIYGYEQWVRQIGTSCGQPNMEWYKCVVSVDPCYCSVGDLYCGTPGAC